MAIKFFDDISLDKQEIQSVALENLGSNPASPTSGQIYFNTATDAIRYYDGAAWIELDGSGNVDSVTGSNGLKNAGSASAVDIEPDYTTAANIVLSAAGTASLVAASKVLVSVGNTVGPYSLTDLGAVINPLGFENWLAGADTGSNVSVTANSVLYFGGGAKITTENFAAAGGAPAETRIIHDNTTRSDSTSTSSPATGGSFTAVTSLTSDATGHVTAINVDTVTLPVASNVTYTIPVAAGASNTAQLVLTPSDGSSGGNTVTIAGTTNEIAITETTGDSGTITIGLPDDVTIGNDLTVTGDMSAVAGAFTGNLTGTTGTFTGLVSGITPTSDANFATKAYVDGLVVGGLNFKGAYNASTNSPALEGASNIASTKGDTYVVDTDGTFIGEQVRVGDVIIVNEDIAASSNPALSKFTVVQANTDLATNTTVGLASFPTTNGFASMTNGAAILSAGAQVTALGSASETVTLTTDAFGKVTTATEQNISITASQVSNFNTTVEGLIDGYRFTSSAFGSSTTATINHNLGSVNVLVQVFLVSDGTTVFAKTARTDANNVTLTFSTAPTAASMKCVIVKCD